MAERTTPPYRFTRGRRAIVAEVHFPKKVEYQSPIFLALRAGLEEQGVKDYLSEHIEPVMQEMEEYLQLFDPRQYERTRMPSRLNISPEDARQRIAMYQSHFKGWSGYEVDGTYLNEPEERLRMPFRERIDEERTQIIRLIFRLESAYEPVAKTERCYDVLEALKRWVMAESGRLDHILPWSRTEKQRFIALHGSWPRHKRAFLNMYYELITKEVKKWIDDTGLFVFGFLIRNFWTKIIDLGYQETEIWVVNYFNANLNTIAGMPINIETVT